MTFEGGKDWAINVSAKQKLNTESLTTAELVGVDHTLPLVPWAPLFLGEQGHNVQENVTNKDNKSTMSLDKNGKTSSRKQTGALNIQF